MECFFEQIEDCMEREPPYCSVACPFHWDIVSFISKMQRDNFTAAYQVYRNGVGFPLIVSECCTQPCKEACPLAPIELARLEQASIAFTRSTEPVRYHVPVKSHSVAIVGAGVAGLAVALRFAERGYGVTVFDREAEIGGHLWNMAEGKRYVASIKSQFQSWKYTFRQSSMIRSVRELADFDVVIIATGMCAAEIDGIRYDRDGAGLVSGYGKYFFAGQINGTDTAGAIADGLMTANRAEAFLKTGLNKPEMAREAVDFPMEIPADWPEKLGIPCSGDAVRTSAVTEAKRCLKCACVHCRNHCDLMRFFRKMPAEIGEEVRVTGTGGLKGEINVATRMIATCNQCGNCTDRCPVNIDTQALFLSARVRLRRQGSYPWAFHDFFLQDMRSANSEMASVIKCAPGMTSCESAFFPGCHLGASDPRYVTETWRALRKKDPAMGMFLHCCGIPAVWAGDEDLQRETFAKIKAGWESLGRPRLVFACPTCYHTFHTCLPEVTGVFAYDMLEAEGSPMLARRVSVFDPCSSRKLPLLQTRVRTLLADAGQTVVELHKNPSDLQCCSFGGHTAIANPQYNRKIVDDRIAQSPYPYVTYCANCRDLFAGAGKEAMHVLDVLLNLNSPSRRPPTLTERRNNRFQLKNTLLLEFWEEKVLADGESTRNIVMDDAVSQKLSDRYLLASDIAQVIDAGRAQDTLLVDEDTGHLIAHEKVGNMTCWAEFSEDGTDIILHNAYAHRMTIQG
jgi:Fe-S oxidoreductase